MSSSPTIIDPASQLILPPSARGPLVRVARVKWERDPEMSDLIDYFDEPRFHGPKIKSDADRFDLLTVREVQTIQGIIEKCRASFSYAARNFFWITTKSRGDQLFKLWESQELIYQELMRLKARGVPMKLQVLKARQLGSSTLIEGLIAWRTMFFRNVNAIVVSYDADHAAYLFGIMQHIFDMMPWILKPQCSSREYKDGLNFENPDYATRRTNPGLVSKVSVQAANKRTGVGTGTRINAGHLSEYGLWHPDYARDVIEQDVGNALAEDDPEMFCILESTARGAGTYSYRLWNKNVELGDQAEWHPLFLPWFFESTRVMAPPRGWRPETPEATMNERVQVDWIRCDNDECRQYQERYYKTADRDGIHCATCNAGTMRSYSLSPDQMYWMQRKRKNAQKEAESLKKLAQEQACTAESAFTLSGTPVFGEGAQEFVNSCVRPPLKEGFLDSTGNFHGCNPKNNKRNPINNEFYDACYLDGCDQDHTFGDHNGEAPYHVWKEPEKDVEYCIGADVAEGLGGEFDYSVGTVLRVNRKGGCDEVVAVFRSNVIDPVAFAQVLNFIGRHYNESMLSIEVNRYDTCMSWVRFQLQYPNLYRWKHMDSINPLSNKLGWLTNVSSKPRLYQTMKRWLQHKLLIAPSRNFAAEMKTFTKDEDERGATAENGSFDDECFPAGTLIQTISGVKPIEEIQIGDLVLTHKGRYMPVEATGVRHEQNELYEVSACGKPKVLATGNHPFYLWKRHIAKRANGKMEKPANPSGRKRRSDFIGSHQVCHLEHVAPAFRQIGDVSITQDRTGYASCSVVPGETIDVDRVDLAQYLPTGYRISEDGELIGFTRGRAVHTMRRVPRYLPVDKDFLLMVGYYLAEGGRGAANVSFASHVRESPLRQWLMGYLKSIGLNPGEYKSSDNGMIVYCSSMVLHSFFSVFKQKNIKTLPEWILKLPADKQKYIIYGYLLGDGCFREQRQIRAVTVSPQMAYQLFQMSLRCGWPVAIQPRKKQTKGNFDQFCLTWSASSAEEIIAGIGPEFMECKRSQYVNSSVKMTHSPLRLKDGYLLGKITSIKKVPFFGPVYNLSVAEDHSYTANGTVVSNCMATQIALYCAHEGDWDDSLGQMSIKRELSMESAPWHMSCGACQLLWPAYNNLEKNCPRCGCMVITGKANRDPNASGNQSDAFTDGTISRQEAKDFAVSITEGKGEEEPDYSVPFVCG